MLLQVKQPSERHVYQLTFFEGTCVSSYEEEVQRGLKPHAFASQGLCQVQVSQITKCRLQVTGCRLLPPAPGYRLPAVAPRLPVTVPRLLSASPSIAQLPI